MKTFLISIFGLVLTVLTPQNTPAQEVPRVKITGKVLDAATGKPLHYVNVFLANTTMGCATNSKGQYAIEYVPLGAYELIVSMIGYEIKRQDIQLTEPKDREFDFRLRSEAIHAPGIQVTATRIADWQSNLRKFKELLLGSSPNALQSKLLNPEVLDFEKDDTVNLFSAKASQPLVIENKALGYKIHLYLESATCSDNILIRFLYTSRFELLDPADEKEEKKWEKNREETYKGSFTHFLAAMASGQLEEEGFLIYKVPDPTKRDDRTKSSKIVIEDIVTPGKTVFERQLGFSDFLKVVYIFEDEPEGYKRQVPSGGTTFVRNDQATQQMSWLKMNLPSTTFNISGYMTNPYAVTKYGYWAWERFADELPLDYIPTNQ